MQIIINGLLQGVLIGAVGVAFALVYRTTKVFHVALGGLFSLSPYIFTMLLTFQFPIWIALFVSTLFISLLGVALEFTIHRPLLEKDSPQEVNLIASLGAYLVLVQLIAIFWGNESQIIRQQVSHVWHFGDVSVAQMQLFGPLFVIIAIGIIHFWLKRTNKGLELRAMSDNPVLLAILGRNIYSLRRVAFGISAGLISMVSVGIAWDVGFSPHDGLDIVLLGMVATIIGGKGLILAPMAGGLLLGLLRAEVVWFGSARWEEAATFILLVLFLFLRPQGIFASKARMESL
ncbi:MAG: hypothetical protein COB83_04065 [Gammaproteobacteria bacterium]|nr:MAG: hypothetical protein COB83_04065 [Gammaproteobacteria bacterium]